MLIQFYINLEENTTHKCLDWVSKCLNTMCQKRKIFAYILTSRLIFLFFYSFVFLQQLTSNGAPTVVSWYPGHSNGSGGCLGHSETRLVRGNWRWYLYSEKHCIITQRKWNRHIEEAIQKVTILLNSHTSPWTWRFRIISSVPQLLLATHV